MVKRSIRLRMVSYFAWSMCSGVWLAASSLLAVSSYIRASNVPWLDALATWAVIFGPLILLVSTSVALLLALVETVAERYHMSWLGRIPGIAVVAGFLFAWLHILLGALGANRVDVAWVETPPVLVLPLVISVLLFVLAPARISAWVEHTTMRLRLLSRVCVLGLIGLIAFVVLEPLDRGLPDPVRLPPANLSRPNVIIIVLDALTSRDMSLYGYNLPTTPRLDKLAKTWSVFTNAHTAATSTSAVLPTILTGRYPYLNRWSRYGDLVRTGQEMLSLPRVLQAAGYETIYGMGGGFAPSAYHLHSGFDRILGAGLGAFNHPQHVVHTFPGRELLNRTRWNPAIAEALLPALSGPFATILTHYDEPMYGRMAQLVQARVDADKRQPFFMYLHMWRPHHPYLGNEFMGRFLPLDGGLTDRLTQEIFGSQPYAPEQQPMVNRLRLRYDENILKADQEIGALIDTLKRQNMYEDSLIIITADHGNTFTQGYQGYSSSEMLAAEHQIPLLVKLPGQYVGQRIDSAVSLVDIAPTVLDVVGAAYPREIVDGQSLLEAQNEPDRIVYVTRLQTDAQFDFDTVAAIQGHAKLILRKQNALLFDLETDPDERTPLIGYKQSAVLTIALEQFKRRGVYVRAGGNIIEAPVMLEPGRPPRFGMR